MRKKWTIAVAAATAICAIGGILWLLVMLYRSKRNTTAIFSDQSISPIIQASHIAKQKAFEINTFDAQDKTNPNSCPSYTYPYSKVQYEVQIDRSTKDLHAPKKENATNPLPPQKINSEVDYKETYIEGEKFSYYTCDNPMSAKEKMHSEANLSLITTIQKGHTKDYNYAILMDLNDLSKKQRNPKVKGSKYLLYNPNRKQFMHSNGIKTFRAETPDNKMVLVNLDNASTAEEYNQNVVRLSQRIEYLKSKHFLLHLHFAIYISLDLLNTITYYSLVNALKDDPSPMKSKISSYIYKVNQVLEENRIDKEYLKWSGNNKGIYGINNLYTIFHIDKNENNLEKRIQDFLVNEKIEVDKNIKKYTSELVDEFSRSIGMILPVRVKYLKGELYRLLRTLTDSQMIDVIDTVDMSSIFRIYNVFLNLKKDHEIVSSSILWDKPIFLIQVTPGSNKSRKAHLEFKDMRKLTSISFELIQQIMNERNEDFMDSSAEPS